MTASRPTSPAKDIDHAQVVGGVDVDLLVAAITGCPSVSAMASSGPGSATTLLPGRTVPGVRVDRGEVHVEVLARWGTTVDQLGREVRAATAALRAGHRLHILIADIDDPPQLAAPPPVPCRKDPS